MLFQHITCMGGTTRTTGTITIMPIEAGIIITTVTGSEIGVRGVIHSHYEQLKRLSERCYWALEFPRGCVKRSRTDAACYAERNELNNRLASLMTANGPSPPR